MTTNDFSFMVTSKSNQADAASSDKIMLLLVILKVSISLLPHMLFIGKALEPPSTEAGPNTRSALAARRGFEIKLNGEKRSKWSEIRQAPSAPGR